MKFKPNILLFSVNMNFIGEHCLFHSAFKIIVQMIRFIQRTLSRPNLGIDEVKILKNQIYASSVLLIYVYL